MSDTNLFKPEMGAPGEFSEVLQIIQQGRAKAFEAINLALMETYWAVGAFLDKKVTKSNWGKGIVKELAQWLQTQAPDARGYSAQNLWRMKQFYQTFSADPKLSALPRVLSWTHYCILLGQCKTPEERYFYTLATQRAHWSKRELEKQINSSAFERTLLADIKLSPVARVLPSLHRGLLQATAWGDRA